MKTKALIDEMLHYFRTAGSAQSEYKEDLPSFVRFAHRIGTDMQTLRAKRKKSRALDAAFRECEELLADRIVDGALHKRFDASFAKFLLSEHLGFLEKEMTEETEEGFALTVTVREPPSKREETQSEEKEAP